MSLAGVGQPGTMPVIRPPAALGLDPFYTKWVDAQGLPVVSSSRVPDAALFEARAIVNHMLERRPDVRAQLAAGRVRIAVMARSELTTDIPEHSDLTPKSYWDQRARGLGATAARPACSCAEENLLQYSRDSYRGESILIHEFAHTVHLLGLAMLDSTFDSRLRGLYDRAMKRGLFEKTYAATNYEEYWAEGVQSWFDANLEASPPNLIHNEINTREELERYDPQLANLIATAFGHTSWRWHRSD